MIRFSFTGRCCSSQYAWLPSAARFTLRLKFVLLLTAPARFKLPRLCSGTVNLFRSDPLYSQRAPFGPRSWQQIEAEPYIQGLTEIILGMAQIQASRASTFERILNDIDLPDLPNGYFSHPVDDFFGEYVDALGQRGLQGSGSLELSTAPGAFRV